MSNKYSWSAANNSMNYNTGNVSGIDGNIMQWTKNTIADGELINVNTIEVLSSRDEYLLDSVNNIESDANGLINLIVTNSANWINDNLSGFNKVTLMKDGVTLTSYIGSAFPDRALTLTGGTGFITTKLNNNVITYKVSDAYTSSYYLLASASNSEINGYSISLGENIKTSAGGFAFDNSTMARGDHDLGIVALSSINSSVGMAFQKSKLSSTAFSMMESDVSGKASIGINSDNVGYITLSLYSSSANNKSLALFNSNVDNHSIGLYSNNVSNYSLGLNSKNVSTYSLGINSEIVNRAISLNSKNTTGPKTFALSINSNDCVDSITINSDFSPTNVNKAFIFNNTDITAFNNFIDSSIIINNERSSADRVLTASVVSSIMINDSEVSNGIAINKSSAYGPNYSIALNNSLSNNFGLAINNSTANSGIAINNSIAAANQLSLYNSLASAENSICFYNINSIENNANGMILGFNSKAVENMSKLPISGSIGLYDSVVEKDNFAYYYSSAISDNSKALFHSNDNSKSKSCITMFNSKLDNKYSAASSFFAWNSDTSSAISDMNKEISLWNNSFNITTSSINGVSMTTATICEIGNLTTGLIYFVNR